MAAGQALPDVAVCRELASALRAGDDVAAAGLAAQAGIPRWLLTHPELGPRGRLDTGDAGEALGCISELTAASGGALAAWLKIAGVLPSRCCCGPGRRRGRAGLTRRGS